MLLGGTERSSKRWRTQPRALMPLCALWITGLAALTLAGNMPAQTVVEGTVRLIQPKALPNTRSAYQIKTSGKVAPPDPPAAVVYLEGNFPDESPTNTAPVLEMGQKDFRFSPTLLVVRKGTRVQFPNKDDEYHNVLSYSKAKEFDLGRYRREEHPPMQVFDKAGVVELYCEIHDFMRGTILVLETPHFTKTDTAGKYELRNLPSGKYRLKAWLDERTVWEKPVELSSGATQRVDFLGK